MIFSTAKVYIYGAIAGVILIAGIGAYWYYSWSQDKIATLEKNNATLTTAVQTQKETIKSIKRDAKLANEAREEVDKEFVEARKEVDALRRKLSRHDIAYLAYKKPDSVERIVTNATADAERCFEILSGSPLTEAEKAVTKKSKANSECPSIANPNYIPRKKR